MDFGKGELERGFEVNSRSKENTERAREQLRQSAYRGAEPSNWRAAGANIGAFLNKLNADERASEEKRDHKISERADREAVRERQRAEAERAAREAECKVRERKARSHSKADTVVQNCKAEYERKIVEVEQQKTGRAYERKRPDGYGTSERPDPEKGRSHEQRKMKIIENQYKAKIAGYEVFMVGSLLYGTLCTLFTVVRSRAFISDFKTFFQIIWDFLRLCAEGLIYRAKWVAQLGDMIPQPTIAAIVHWLLQLVVVATVAVGAGCLLFVISRKLYEGYKENFADRISLAELLISFAVVVFFAEPIRSFLPINLFLLLILTHVLYIGIRQYIKGWRRARGYY